MKKWNKAWKFGFGWWWNEDEKDGRKLERRI